MECIRPSIETDANRTYLGGLQNLREGSPFPKEGTRAVNTAGPVSARYVAGGAAAIAFSVIEANL